MRIILILILIPVLDALKDLLMLHSHPTIHDLMRADLAETRRRMLAQQARTAGAESAVGTAAQKPPAASAPVTDSLAARASASATLGLMRAMQRLAPPRLILAAAPPCASEPPEPSPTLSESWVAL